MKRDPKNLWGGRFVSGPDKDFARFNSSFAFDRRLFSFDIRASIAYAEAIHAAGVLTTSELRDIRRGLNELAENSLDNVPLNTTELEDVHTYIETKLVELIGDAGKKLHTGRSRNDQVVTALRLWVRDEIDQIRELLQALQTALLAVAERHLKAVLPGYTHLQRAQPVLWPHWCLAYFEMLVRDRERVMEARRRVNVLPLGSGALAGSGAALDRDAMAKKLGFDGVTLNSIDAVSDRDFAIEFASCCSSIMVHLSRLAEDLILYCTTEFGFIELSDSVSSGSSLMPQKKNPDALELIRGKAGRVFGQNFVLLTMMKGLPLAYNKDMQEDKQAVFDCAETVRACLQAAALVLDNVRVNESRARQAASTGYLNATELADHLVRKGMPFRESHEMVGRIVLFAMKKGKELGDLELSELRRFSSKIGPDVFEALTPESALASKDAIGGTSPRRVRQSLARARKYLRKDR